VVDAAHHAFVTGFNTIAMVTVAVAAVGSVAGYVLVRSRDFVAPRTRLSRSLHGRSRRGSIGAVGWLTCLDKEKTNAR
jgi:hypothetical protein